MIKETLQKPVGMHTREIIGFILTCGGVLALILYVFGIVG